MKIYKLILAALLWLTIDSAFSQTKIVIYNNNTNQIENKVFANNLVSSFTYQEFNFEATDKTPNINYLLRNQGQNVESGNVSDEAVVLVCDKLEVDYVVNFILYPSRTTNNVYASLINTKTYSVDKILTLTCSNLKNGSDVKATTDEIATIFLLGNLIAEKKAMEIQALAEQKAKEEKALAEKKTRKEKLLAEQKAKEEKATAKQRSKEEKIAAEQREREEKQLYSPLALVFDGGKIFQRGNRLSKNEIRGIMAGTDALRIYNKGISKSKKGNTLITIGTIVLAGGIVAKVVDDTPMGYEPGLGMGKKGDIIVWSAIGAGTAMILPGITLKVLSKRDIKKSVGAWNNRDKIAELKCNFTGNGVNFTLSF